MIDVLLADRQSLPLLSLFIIFFPLPFHLLASIPMPAMVTSWHRHDHVHLAMLLATGNGVGVTEVKSRAVIYFITSSSIVPTKETPPQLTQRHY